MSGAARAGEFGLPASIGRYRILARLAQDDIGEILKGFDPLIERPVIVRVFHLQAIDPDAVRAITSRFYEETQRIGVLVHPGIVPLFDAGECPGGLFMASEYVDGGSLADVIAEPGAPDVPMSMSLIGQLVEAIDHAHGFGVAHRNLRPTSVRITPDAAVKLGGFGVAAVEDAMMPFVGDPKRPLRYRAPERLRGEAGDERADVFSLAVLMLDVFAEGVVGSDDRLAAGPPVPPGLAARGVAADPWARLFGRALAADPARRPGSVRELFDALLAVVGVDRPDTRPPWDALSPGGTPPVRDAETVDTSTAVSAGVTSEARTVLMGGTRSGEDSLAAESGRRDDIDPGSTITKL